MNVSDFIEFEKRKMLQKYKFSFFCWQNGETFLISQCYSISGQVDHICLIRQKLYDTIQSAFLNNSKRGHKIFVVKNNFETFLFIFEKCKF